MSAGKIIKERQTDIVAAGGGSIEGGNEAKGKMPSTIRPTRSLAHAAIRLVSALAVRPLSLFLSPSPSLALIPRLMAHTLSENRSGGDKPYRAFRRTAIAP